MGRVYYDAKNSFYRFHTLQDITLRSGLADTAWVFATTPECVKCGKRWPAPYRLTIPKSRIVAGLALAQQLPLPQDQKIVEQAMSVICNMAVGCWTDCGCGKGFNMKCLNDCVAKGVEEAREGDCPCICPCKVGCGNKRIYPCRCGHVDQFHMKGCPVGNFKRDSSFIVALMRDRMMRRARRLQGV